LLASTLAVFRTRAALQLEIITLRHQLGVLQRSVKRPKLNRFDRFLWAWFCGVWDEWRSALCIVKPQTVIAWHRKGFRLFWTWKVRRGQRGRPPVSKEIRKLIRKMSRENPIWGAPRIHGDLKSFVAYYHETRAHLSLDKDTPTSRSVQPPDLGQVVALPQVGGLHHRYERRAA
jgi:hypothetical protein